MATQPMDRYTLEDYLDLEDKLDYRSEFHDGSIIPVEAASPTHARLEARVGSILEKAFFPRCATFGSSLNLYIPSVNRTLHPDASVICGNLNYPKPDCVDNPTVIVEITSPKTKDYDHGTKRECYFTLPSLQHYLLISQTERLVGHYERSGIGWIYVDRRADAIVVLGGVEIPVADIYEGIFLQTTYEAS